MITQMLYKILEMSNQRVIFSIEGASVHELNTTFKKKIIGGTCDIEVDQQGHVILKIKHFTKVISKLLLGFVEYRDSISYFYDQSEYESSVYAISFSKIDNPLLAIQQIKTLLRKNAKVRELETQKKLLSHVKECYPQWVTTEVQMSSSKMSKEVGEIIGTIGSMFKGSNGKGAHHSDLKSSTSVKRLDTKQNIEISTSDYTHKNTSKSVGRHSHHEKKGFLDSIKKFGEKTKNALNQGYYEASHKNDTH